VSQTQTGGLTALDYEEIRQLVARYNFAIDLGDADGWVACFTPDGVFECSGVAEDNPFGGRYEGAEALRDYAVKHYRIAKGHARHWNWNLQIDGNGAADEATMQCYLMALSTRPPGNLGGSTGIYRDRLRKVDGAWRFVERHVTVDA
jgi:hypothetical protein